MKSKSFLYPYVNELPAIFMTNNFR
jgi:hypothetical protein